MANHPAENKGTHIMKNSRLATAFITTIAISGLAMLGGSVLKMTALHQYCLLYTSPSPRD